VSRIQDLDTPARVIGGEIETIEKMKTLETMERRLARTHRNCRPGDRVRMLGNHICTTMSVRQHVWAMRGKQVVTGWKVAARGELR